MSTAETLRETLSDASAMSAKMFRVRLPFIAEFRNYSWKKLRADLLAGATLTLVSIPQAIGFALILGLPPMSVILSVVIGGFVSALFFSSHHHVFGPTTSVSLITATTIAANTGLGLDPLPLAAYLAFLIGAVQFLAGLLNFGEITKFISRSVVVAYTAAIGILLITSQLPNLLGFGVPAGQRFVTILTDVWGALARVNVSPWAIGIGLLTLGIFEGIRLYRKTWPEALIGLATLGLLSRLLAFFIDRNHLFGLSAVPFRLVKDEGALMAAFPKFAGLPAWSEQMEMLPTLASTAIAVAIIGMLEATAITKSLAAKSGQRLDPNQELMGMGAGNIAVGLFGVTPGSSSFTRSAVNYQSGAASQLSTMLSSVVVLLILLFVTPVFNYIPVAALAAHLMRVGYRLINRPQIRVATRSTRSDAVVFIATLGAALFLRLDTAIYVGIGVALALFLQKTSMPSLVEYSFSDNGILAELVDPAKRPNPQISIIHVEGDLFFGAADLFQEHLRRQAEDENIRIFILRMKNARHLDASTVMAMETLHDYLRKTGRYLLISGCNLDVLRVLQRSGLLAQIGEENVFPAEVNLTMSTKRALKRASQLLKQDGAAGSPDVRIFYDSRRQQAKAGGPASEPERPEDYSI
ncbi:MAG TPA: SulP family inorganic anion transporter [Opitutaceae bacterium]|jgi:SulP family sulfate permease|nr:SulP family inorganic anion transporter [Opitutaceae bacterium]